MERKQAVRDMVSAIRNHDYGKVVGLLKHQPDLLNETTPFGTWLHIASAEDAFEIVKYLVSTGFDVNKCAGTFNGNSLNEAAGEGHIDIVKYLKIYGAEFDISEPERNPLFSAIYGGHKDIVKFLLHSGIDASVRYTGDYMKDMDAYDFAIERGQKEIAEMLLPYKK